MVAGTGIGVGVSLYLCSDSVHGVKSVMSVADWLSSSADKLKDVYDRQPLSNSNFFIRGLTAFIILYNIEFSWLVLIIEWNGCLLLQMR